MPSVQSVELSDFKKINDEFMHLHYEIHALKSENIALRIKRDEKVGSTFMQQSNSQIQCKRCNYHTY